MFSKISEKEIELINLFREKYSDPRSPKAEPMCSAEQFLKPWKRAKELYLYKMFGEKLILSKPVKITAPEDHLRKQIDHDFNIEGSVMSNFYAEWRDKVGKYFRTRGENGNYVYPSYIETKIGWEGIEVLSDKNSELFSALFYDILCSKTLATNTWPWASVKYILPKSGKTLTLTKNETKIMRVIQRVAEEIGIDKVQFENFRIYHSRYFNTAKLSGNLCLSIHPLDYITMSENASNWVSCMNWRERGCYRQGTVEMLNSDCVVVAYLDNVNKPLEVDGLTWNNKMWRELFVVHDDIICEIKPYPYECNELTVMVLDWLKELYNANIGITNFTDTPALFEPFSEDDNGGYYEFTNGNMYNDFNCTNNGLHWGYFNTEVGHSIIRYSGKAECVWCGQTETIEEQNVSDIFVDPGKLICVDCGNYVGRCEGCGEAYCEGEGVEYINEYGSVYHYCQECAREILRACPITGEVGNVHMDVRANKFVWLGLQRPSADGVYDWILVKDKCWEDYPEQWAEIATSNPAPYGCGAYHYTITRDQTTEQGLLKLLCYIV